MLLGLTIESFYTWTDPAHGNGCCNKELAAGTVEAGMGWSISSVLCGDDFLGYVFKNYGGTLSQSVCSDLQRQSVAKEINVPGKPYVSDKGYQDILAMADADGFVSIKPDEGSHQCVALVKAAIPALGATGKWRKGNDLSNSNIANVPVGAAIGYGFVDGRYLSMENGNHVAILVSVDGGDVKILDQWDHDNGKYQVAEVHSVDLSLKRWSVVTRVQPEK
jgi:hypothetical protein